MGRRTTAPHLVLVIHIDAGVTEEGLSDEQIAIHCRQVKWSVAFLQTESREDVVAMIFGGGKLNVRSAREPARYR